MMMRSEKRTSTWAETKDWWGSSSLETHKGIHSSRLHLSFSPDSSSSQIKMRWWSSLSSYESREGREQRDLNRWDQIWRTPGQQEVIISPTKKQSAECRTRENLKSMNLKGWDSRRWWAFLRFLLSILLTRFNVFSNIRSTSSHLVINLRNSSCSTRKRKNSGKNNRKREEADRLGRKRQWKPSWVSNQKNGRKRWQKDAQEDNLWIKRKECDKVCVSTSWNNEWSKEMCR